MTIPPVLSQYLGRVYLMRRGTYRFRKFGQISWGESCHPVTRIGGFDVNCQGPLYVSLVMWMVCPNQAVSLQGHQCVSIETLVGNDPGIVSGWQQSKKNWALSAVVGEQTRMTCDDLWCGQLTGLVIFRFVSNFSEVAMGGCVGGGNFKCFILPVSCPHPGVSLPGSNVTCEVYFGRIETLRAVASAPAACSYFW